MYLCIHVDDMLILAENKEMINKFKDYLLTKLKSVTLFHATNDGIKYIGMHIQKVRNGSRVYFELNQEEYITLRALTYTNRASYRRRLQEYQCPIP